MISEIDFTNQTLIKECIAQSKAFILKNSKPLNIAKKKWNPEYISSLNPGLDIPIKQYTEDNSINVSKLKLQDYVEYLQSQRIEKNLSEVLYCHDIPMLSMIEKLVEDINTDFLFILPKWYHHRWWRYAQFFMGPKGSWTPLHFDCLLTHNIFFQVYGNKRFYLIDAKDKKYCGRVGWRWFEFNPEEPNSSNLENIDKVNVKEILVEAGDILYMPPGMLHAVRGLDESISFNIDFHTAKSSLNGVSKILAGMPMQNVYYNFVCMLGLVFKVPSQILFRLYSSYLNYVS